ncbi:MAG: DUF4278 domain-containing protein [Oscillatoria sp. PMC 1068.18]|nr:DUF4278 domain-containing protein [Oscillatoria sp. PMC 1076.18]MEC4988194.1 DUF4278 domain-containing protein [Oscillatoria sp. PMC 1068.18]
MKLSYRGIGYDRQSLSLEVLEGEIIGKYRGQDIRAKYPRHIPQLQPKVYLQYRGIAYSKRPVVKCQALPLTQPNSTVDPCTFLSNQVNRGISEEAAQIHLDNIRRSLERRMQVAKATGNQDLVRLLEQESQELSLNA